MISPPKPSHHGGGGHDFRAKICFGFLDGTCQEPCSRQMAHKYSTNDSVDKVGFFTLSKTKLTQFVLFQKKIIAMDDQTNTFIYDAREQSINPVEHPSTCIKTFPQHPGIVFRGSFSGDQAYLLLNSSAGNIFEEQKSEAITDIQLLQKDGTDYFFTSSRNGNLCAYKRDGDKLILIQQIAPVSCPIWSICIIGET